MLNNVFNSAWRSLETQIYSVFTNEPVYVADNKFCIADLS